MCLLRSSASLVALLVSLSVACTAGPEEETAEGADALSDGVAKACVESPDPAACLGAKAKERLGKALADVEADLSERKLLAASEGARYRIRTIASCFDMAKEKEVGAAWDQMKATVDFLSEFHRDRGGRGNRWFSDVLVCNAKDLDDNTLVRGGISGGELRLEGTTLQVGVKRGLFGGFTIQKGLEIRDRWDRGEHFAKTSLDDPKGIFRTKAWPVINPVGVVRVQALPAIREAASALAASLRTIRSMKDLGRQKTALLAAVQSNTSVRVALDGSTLGEKAERAISGADAGGVTDMIDAWIAFLTGPGAADDAHEAVGAIQQGAAGRACNVDVKQFCLVAVNNAHCIDVQLSAGARLVSKFVANEASAGSNVVHATQAALVCVQTNDFVDVNVNLGADRALASAGLASALGAR